MFAHTKSQYAHLHVFLICSLTDGSDVLKDKKIRWDELTVKSTLLSIRIDIIVLPAVGVVVFGSNAYGVDLIDL